MESKLYTDDNLNTNTNTNTTTTNTNTNNTNTTTTNTNTNTNTTTSDSVKNPARWNEAQGHDGRNQDNNSAHHPNLKSSFDVLDVKEKEEILQLNDHTPHHYHHHPQPQPQQDNDSSDAVSQSQSNNQPASTTTRKQQTSSYESELDEKMVEQGIKDAITALSATVEPDEHKRHQLLKHADRMWMEYVERRLPEIQLEQPDLRVAEYKSALWDEWLKLGSNPLHNAHRIVHLEPQGITVMDTDQGKISSAPALLHLTDTELKALSKKDLVEMLQQHASEEFRICHQLEGEVERVAKRKTRHVLIADYHDLHAMIS